jgi:glycopeptide antibiotics resistance protein
MMINFGWAHIYAGLGILVAALIMLWKQNKSFSYLLFFSIFWIYLMGVVSVVVFPFPISIPNPDFKLRVNLFPFRFGDCSFLVLCIRNIYENILLTIPFGFGINFIARVKPGNVVWLAIAVGLTFEITQLVISLIFKSAFRAVDINDVILNATGVVLGYGIYRTFVWLYSFTILKLQIRPRYIFAYIYDIVRQQN